jgi:hypothetical protein
VVVVPLASFAQERSKVARIGLLEPYPVPTLRSGARPSALVAASVILSAFAARAGTPLLLV